ncbi:MAG: PilN domain-containing protein, partial [Synergistales bacterium]|nr:PilN domain-containing protein [Synergistales bacterium]
AFILLSSVAIGAGFFFSRNLKEEKASLERSVEELQAQQVLLTAEANRLKGLEKLYGEALGLLQSELPALEFLASLEASLPPGVWLGEVALSGTTAALNGMAFAENDVVSFGRALTEATAVGEVGLPVSSRVAVGGKNRVSFKLSCSLNDLESVTIPQTEAKP